MPRRILVVDDEADVRDLMMTFLEDSGYTVTSCGDGYSALNEISNGNYDLVFLDVMMPDMDGLATLRKIRQLNPKLKIVVMTGSLSDSVFDQCVDDEHEADGFINKPFRMENLLTCLDIVLVKGGKYICPL